MSIRGSDGYYSHTTQAASLFGAVTNAIEFFNSAFWKGPKPGPATVFRVNLVSKAVVYLVRAEALERWGRSVRPRDRRNGAEKRS